MNRQKAMNIGGVQGLKLAGIGLLIAYMMMAVMAEHLFWFIEMDSILYLVIGAAIFLAMGYYWGTKAGIAIIMKSKHSIGTGILYGLITLITTSVLSTLPGFFIERMDVYYLLAIMICIPLFGLIPAVIASIWFGWSIRERGLAHGPIQWHQL